MRRLLDPRFLEYDNSFPEGWEKLREDVLDKVMERMQRHLRFNSLIEPMRDIADDHGHPLEFTVENAVEILSRPQAEVFRIYFMGYVLSIRDWERWTDPVRMFIPEISAVHFVEILCKSQSNCIVGLFVEEMRKNRDFAGVVLAEAFSPDLDVFSAAWWRGNSDFDFWLIDKLASANRRIMDEKFRRGAGS